VNGVSVRGRKFSDLTKQEKALLIGTLTGSVTMFAAFVVYYQLVGVEDRLHIVSLINSGASVFVAVRLMLLSFYFVIVFPTIIVMMATAAGLLKRPVSFVLKNILFCLAATSLGFLLSAFFLTFFGILFSSASLAIQAIFMVFAFLISTVVTIRTLMLKKVLNYSKKLFQ
jgi:hypothetical protein